MQGNGETPKARQSIEDNQASEEAKDSPVTASGGASDKLTRKEKVE